MAKVIMTCGKICCGKSTYAGQIRKRDGAVLLSIDEIMLALFDGNAGHMHDEYVERTEKLLLDKSAEIVGTGINVVLDWGFWTKAKRSYVREFFKARDIQCEFHYIDVSDEVWRQRLNKRNELVSAGKVSAYFVDDGLAAKFESIFEAPSDDEIDVWVRN